MNALKDFFKGYRPLSFLFSNNWDWKYRFVLQAGFLDGVLLSAVVIIIFF